MMSLVTHIYILVEIIQIVDYVPNQLPNMNLNVSHIEDHQVLEYQPVSIEMIYVVGILIQMTDILGLDDPQYDSH